MSNGTQNGEDIQRILNPSDISISSDYIIEVFAQGLDSPISMLFTNEGDMLIAESGFTTGNPRVLRLVDGRFEVVADQFNVPLTGITYFNGILYVSHRGFISIVEQDGTRRNIITGLPSNGDYFNSRVVIGPDNKLYFGQGTATNSGVVGLDNDWVFTNPLVCDYPGEYIILNAQNFETDNILIERPEREIIYTGAYSPYGVPNVPFELRKGVVRASGSILRANLDGTELELFAWGFRNPVYIEFDALGRLFASNNGYEVRGSRPIANALDEFFLVTSGVWYGWPDYSGGEPVNLPRFKPDRGQQPELLLTQHPNTAPRPYAVFPPNSVIMGFDFNYNKNFGPYGDVYIAEFGGFGTKRVGDAIPYLGTGQRIARIDMRTGGVTTFAINKSGFPASLTKGGGFERPADVVFGPEGAMYVLDLGWNVPNSPGDFIPNTGVIWRINKK
jgi:glucose/arabinose dehydrogenase